jgi:hypothetical protein
MKRGLLWTIATFLTLFLLVYQRITGPTYPLRGKTDVEGTKIAYRLPRTHETTAGCDVRIERISPGLRASLVFRRFKTKDPFSRIPMQIDGEHLTARLPRQPAAGKLEYRIFVSLGGDEASLTGSRPVVIRYKDPVPAPIVVAHIIAIFLAFLFSTRTGLEALKKDGNPRRLALWTVGFLILGGMILGPLMQKYAFGAFWTGFPIGHDLTDNKTLIALIGWIVALIAMRKGRPARGWALGAALLLMAVFMVPHSLLGSELDYSKQERPPAASPAPAPRSPGRPA